MRAEQPALTIEVEFALLDTIHSSLRSLVTGTIGSVVGIAVCAFASQSKILIGQSLVLLFAGLARLAVTFVYRGMRFSLNAGMLKSWKRCSYWSGVAFSASLGAAVFTGIITIDDPVIATGLVALVIGYAAGTAGRAAAEQFTVITCLILCLVPIAGAMMLLGTKSSILLGMLCLFYVFGLAEISKAAHATLVDALVLGQKQKLLATELTSKSDKLDAALTNMSHGLAMFDAEGRLAVCNRRFVELFGLDEESRTKGVSPSSIIQAAVRSGLIPVADIHRIEAEFVAKTQCRVKEHMVMEIHEGRTFELSFQTMARGGSVVVIDDITERRAQEAEIAHMARFDKLTGLPNRAQFEQKVAEILGESDRSGRPFAVVCIDLDHFKEVNDTLTHMVGDQLLMAVAERMRTAIRSCDFIARFGGDEFALILSSFDDNTATAEISIAIQRLIDIIVEPYEVDSHEIVIGMSAGVAVAPVDGRCLDDILRAADLALHEAKQQGRGGFRFFESSLDIVAQERRQTILDMRVGMAEGQFFLEYQPIVEIKTGRIVCCEALMRWNHPTKRMSPDKFIAVAEETGMILELGRWAINRACEDAVAWPDSVSVAVNLSPVQFKRGNLIETVKAALRNSGLDARRLDLEITESLLITQDAATRRIVDGVVDMGCSLSLDDFGTGYSTFGYLISFPFKKVKLDKGFIEHLKTRPEHRAIIRAVGQMARDMSMSIVAEGVENLSQFEILEAEKVHYAQGWLFSRSVVSAEIPWKKFDKMISGAVNSDVSRAA